MVDLYIESRLQAIKDIASSSCADIKDADNIASFCDEIYSAIPNIGKVVEELEEIINPKEMYFCRVSKGRCIHNEDDIACIDCVAQRAIKIVEQNS